MVRFIFMFLEIYECGIVFVYHRVVVFFSILFIFVTQHYDFSDFFFNSKKEWNFGAKGGPNASPARFENFCTFFRLDMNERQTLALLTPTKKEFFKKSQLPKYQYRHRSYYFRFVIYATQNAPIHSKYTHKFKCYALNTVPNI